MSFPSVASQVVVTASAPKPILSFFLPVSAGFGMNASAPFPTRAISAPSANYVKEQIVHVYSASGQFIDVWRDAPLMGSDGCQGPKFTVNALTAQITMTLPRSFDSFDEAGNGSGRGSVGAGNIVQIWVVDNASITDGKLIFNSYIDGYAPEIDDNGDEKVTITLTPWDAALGDVKFVGTQDFGTAGLSASYVDPVVMFNWPFQNINSITGKPYTAPLTLDPSNPVASGIPYQAQFKNQSIDAWNEVVRTLAPANWFWRANPNQTVTFRLAPTLPTHTFIIGQHCAIPTYQKFYQNLYNDIYVQGTTVTARATGTDVSAYGQRTYVVVEPRIIDAATCTRYAQALLAQLDVVDYRSTLTLIDIRSSGTSAGYDIETVTVGDTCRLENPQLNYETSLWDQFVWDQDAWDFDPGAQINQTVTIAGVTHNFDRLDIELSTLQPSQDRFLTDLAQKFEQSQFS